MSDKERDLKVTDKRMFTADGELREEYRFLNEKATAEPSAPPAEEAPAPQPAQSPVQPAEPPSRRSEAAPPQYQAGDFAPAERPEPPPLELPGSPPGFGGPTFFDLAAMLAEPAALYLGDLEVEGEQPPENLEMARMHIELLDVLRQKTAGNLTAQESAFVEDLLYRLRVRYVQKRG